MPTVTVNGVDLHYERTGSGPVAMVLVHGGFSSHSTWSLVAPLLAESGGVLAYDRRGHSRSGPPRGNITVGAHVADLAGLIEAMSADPVWVVGTSYGAHVALRLVGSRPDLVRGIVAHEPALLLSLIAADPDHGHLADDLSRRERTVAEQISRGDHEAAVRQFVDTVLGPGTWDLLPVERRETHIENAPAVLEEISDPDRNDFDLGTLIRFPKPVLLTRGEQSPAFFVPAIRRFEAALPHAEVVTFPGAGHAPHLTHPDAYARVVSEFVREHGG